MKNPTLVKRYVEGLAAALHSPAEYDAVSGELSAFASLVRDNDELHRSLLRPFLNPAKKARIVRAVLELQKVDPKTSRFVQLLLQHRRLEILPSVLAGLPDAWRDCRGLPSFEVRSVVALSAGQRKTLESELERLEKRPVHCEYGIDPALVGGLTVRKGNRVYDVSLKGQLERLQDTISER